MLTSKQIQVMRFILRGNGYSKEFTDQIMNSAEEWYPIWLEFKKVALENRKNGIFRGRMGYLGQMQILGEIRKKCPARGNVPYEVNNDYAPVFARFFNAITKSEYFELREISKSLSENNR